jgi:hypothetical protein
MIQIFLGLIDGGFSQVVKQQKPPPMTLSTPGVLTGSLQGHQSGHLPGSS